MTLRPTLALAALIATPALAAEPSASTSAASSASQPSVETSSARTSQRRNDRRPVPPLRQRVIEAPGAAMMMIPASFSGRSANPRRAALVPVTGDF